MRTTTGTQPREGDGFERTHFYPSECGSCARRIYYDMINAPNRPQKSHEWQLKRAGKIYHDVIQQDIIATYGEDFIACEERLEADFEVNGEIFTVRGRPDGYIKPATVVEIKSMGKDPYKLILQRGLSGRPYFMDYARQGTFYALLIEENLGVKADEIRIIPVNRDNGEVYSVGIPTDVNEELLTPTWERWSEVQTSFKSGQPPYRMYQKPAFECMKFCRYSRACWEREIVGPRRVA